MLQNAVGQTEPDDSQHGGSCTSLCFVTFNTMMLFRLQIGAG